MARIVQDVRYELLDSVFENKKTNYYDSQIEPFLRQTESAFKRLKHAQKAKTLNLPKDFSLDALGHSDAFSSLTYDLTLACFANPDSDRAVEYVGMTLRIARDTSRCADEISQLVANRFVRYAVNEQALKIVETTTDQTRIQNLIKILADAHRHEDVSPGYIEMARFEHLQIRKVLHDLRSGSFQADPFTLKTLGLAKNLPNPIIVHKIMTTDIMGGYRANDDLALQALKDAVGDDPKRIAQAEKLIDDSKKSPVAIDAAAGLLIPIVMQTVGAMTDVDYEKELTVLNQRYQQIESAHRLPFPKRIDKLHHLADHWTEDDSWKSLKLMKWYRPKKRLGSFSYQTRLLLSGMLSLACVKNYQLGNDGRLPTDVDQAMQYAGLEDSKTFIDPFSGDCLKLHQSKGGMTIIYSVGPDCVDNNGSPNLFDEWQNRESIGDFSFKLKR